MALLISIALAVLGFVTGVVWFYIPIAAWGLVGLYWIFLKARLAKSQYDLRLMQEERRQRASNESGQGALEYIAVLPLLAVVIGIIAFVVWLVLQIF